MTTFSFEQFVATGTEVADLGKAMSAEFYGENGEVVERPGRMYEGGAYIEQEADGSFMLVMGNEQYFAPADRVDELESRLYLYACDDGYFDSEPSSYERQLARVKGLDERDVSAYAFAYELENMLGEETMRKIAQENTTAPAGVCATNDYCDANMVMLAVLNKRGIELHDEEFDEAANDAWMAARFYIGQKFGTPAIA